MSDPKYVIVESDTGIECPILFPNYLIHADVAFRFNRAQRVVSAGFFSLGDGKAHCWGKSESLKVESRPEDAAILLKHFGG